MVIMLLRRGANPMSWLLTVERVEDLDIGGCDACMGFASPAYNLDVGG